MNTKLISLALTSVALTIAAKAAPFLAIGDGAELFATGSLGIRADDNIFLSNNATSDTIFDITPGMELTFGKDSQVKGALTLVDAFSNYSSHSNLNTDLFSADFGAGYSDGKLKLDLSTGFHELNQNSVDIHGLTRRDVTNFLSKGEMEVSQITSLSAGFSFTHTNYKRAGYGDSNDYTVPVNFYYKWTPKIDLSAGYQYRFYEIQKGIGPDSTDNYFNVGARGEFTPKLNGQFTVGITRRSFSHLSDETMLGLDASLTYAFSEKTSFQVGASSSPDTSPQGQQQKNFSLNGAVNCNLSDQWKVHGGLSYRAIDYLTRTDHYVEATLGATYVISTYVNIVGAYAYRNNSSVIATGEFTNNVFSVAANLRY
jgi:hypothetical protein